MIQTMSPLELRPTCECCDADLPPESNSARICTYECTYCATCAEEMGGRCKNCGGNLERRPIRPASLLGDNPASTTRVFNPSNCPVHGSAGAMTASRDASIGANARLVHPADFTGSVAWDAELIAAIDGATVRLHWTDQPYRWHVNDGQEVFVVLDGEVDMHVRLDGVDDVHRLEVGDIFYAGAGVEHVAHPVGTARILVIEREGSA